MRLKSVVLKYESYLLRLPNVVAVHEGKKGNTGVIKVIVTRKLARAELSAQEMVPRVLDEYETDVEEAPASSRRTS